MSQLTPLSPSAGSLRPAADTSRRFISPRPSGWTVATILIALIVALPIIVVLTYLARPSGDVWAHLAGTVLVDYVTNSLLLMLGVGAGTFVVGVGTAWLVTMYDIPGRRVFEWALLLPLALPAYVIAYTYTGLLDYAGPVQEALRAAFGWTSRRDYWFPEIRSLGGAVAMMTLVLYPYVYMLARAAFLEQSVCALEVSRTLGCGPWRSFARVGLPLARPAVVAGLALVLMETLNDFGTVHFFAVDTFTTGIYRTWFGLGQPAVAAQLGALLMVFVAALIVAERLSRGTARFHHTSTRYRILPHHSLSPARKAAALIACWLPVLLGFLVPAGALLVWTLDVADTMIDRAFLARTVNSLTLASVAAGLAVAVALVLAYGVRLRPSRATRGAARLASMGYAIPGSVIAVGVLLPFAAFDNAVDAAMRSVFGVSTGLILTGTIAAVVFGYLVRFLAVAYNTVEASLGKVTSSMDGAARTLGLTPSETLRRVHVPLVRGSLLTGGILVFVDVMKELPATLIMRPFNFDTLAIRTFELAGDERLRDAAPSALAIVLVGVFPVIMISRAIARSRPGRIPGRAKEGE